MIEVVVMGLAVAFAAVIVLAGAPPMRGRQG
jgi:ATP-dependent protease ClpP protease subunit